jgi:hypothetical protein
MNLSRAIQVPDTLFSARRYSLRNKSGKLIIPGSGDSEAPAQRGAATAWR